MRFLGPGPCVPLKLTSIASIRDLRVNLWVLADNRVVPDNFYEMEINQARIDWFSDGIELRAAGEGGRRPGRRQRLHHRIRRARPTCCADALYQPGRYNLDGIRLAPTPPDALDLIGSRGSPGTAPCWASCAPTSRMPDALRAMGVDERNFYNQLRLVLGQPPGRASSRSTAPALAADLDAKLVDPPARGPGAVRPAPQADPAGHLHLARGDDRRSRPSC